MRIQSSLEGIDRWSADHFTWKTIPVIYDASDEGKLPNSGGSHTLANLEWVAPCCAISQGKEGEWVGINPTMEQLVGINHISSSTTIVQRGELQYPQLLLVRLTAHSLNKSCGSSLHSFHLALVGPIKWPP